MLDCLSTTSLIETESSPSSDTHGEMYLTRVGEQVSSLPTFFTFFKKSAQKSSVFLCLGGLEVNFVLHTPA